MQYVPNTYLKKIQAIYLFRDVPENKIGKWRIAILRYVIRMGKHSPTHCNQYGHWTQCANSNEVSLSVPQRLAYKCVLLPSSCRILCARLVWTCFYSRKFPQLYWRIPVSPAACKTWLAGERRLKRAFHEFVQAVQARAKDGFQGNN